MKTEHNFDIKKLASELSLTFYQQVKLVNYIRRQVSVFMRLQQNLSFDDIVRRCCNDMRLQLLSEPRVLVQVHQHTCPECEEKCGTPEQLRAHLMEQRDHVSSVPPARLWDQPE